MSGWRENEHVITTRRPSAGICWLVVHLESMTQLLATRMRGEPPGRVSRRPGAGDVFGLQGQGLGARGHRGEEPDEPHAGRAARIRWAIRCRASSVPG